MDIHEKCLIGAVLLMMLTSVWIEITHAEENKMNRERSVGGQCEYKAYSGSARIVSVKEMPQPSGASEKKFEILFTFHSDQTIVESFARTEGEKFSLLDDNACPSQAFIRQHGIALESVFPCVMKVIVRGACTPILFEFPVFSQNK